jgi:hypothetical protein
VAFEDTLIGFADWQGYPRASAPRPMARAPRGERPEIDAFRAAPTPDAPQYVRGPRRWRPRMASRPAAPAPNRSARGACEARASASLNAFTYIPDRLARPAPASSPAFPSW